MKYKIIYLIIVIFTFSCKNNKIVNNNSITPSENKFIIINNNNVLSTVRLNDYEFAFMFNTDTIYKDITYRKMSEVLSSLGAFGADNWYLIQLEAGDGCPEQYKIFAVKPDGKWYLSETFGNCNEISYMSFTYPDLKFYFEGFEEANRKPDTIMFNTLQYKMLNK